MAAEVGDPAPDFTLAGSDNTDDGRRDYSLAEYRGQVVVLVFYPGDSTPVCTRQLNSYTEDIDSFTEAGAQVLADLTAVGARATTTSRASRAASRSRCWPTRTRRSARRTASSVRSASTGARRSSIDAEGVVRYAHRAVAGLTFRSTDELRRAP